MFKVFREQVETSQRRKFMTRMYKTQKMAFLSIFSCCLFTNVFVSFIIPRTCLLFEKCFDFTLGVFSKRTTWKITFNNVPTERYVMKRLINIYIFVGVGIRFNWMKWCFKNVYLILMGIFGIGSPYTMSSYCMILLSM